MIPPSKEKISALDRPELQPYLTLRRSEEHMKRGIFVAEGERVVRRLLNSSLQVLSFLLTPEWYDALSDTEKRFGSSGAEAYVADKALLEGIVGYRLHQGIMAVGRIPQDPSLDAVLSKRGHHLLVALDGLMNAENVGVVVRNCAGFGVDAILVGETSSSPYLRRAVRNSMGAVFTMPVIRMEKLATSLRKLNGAGVRVIAAHGKGSAGIINADLSGSICIVLGNEESGVSSDVLAASSAHVAIPMHGQVDSLNVASAAAVFLYEADRQRRSDR